MNKDDIIRMAREAGYVELANNTAMHPPNFLERFAELVAVSERESCAQISSHWDKDHPDTNYGVCIAAAIRARGQV